MRQEVSFGKLKLTNNKGASNNMTQVGLRPRDSPAPSPSLRPQWVPRRPILFYKNDVSSSPQTQVPSHPLWEETKSQGRQGSVTTRAKPAWEFLH